ncbi:MAG: leucine-rich repeat domain-containing protein [Clostridia bacterium]|nr:leucine-rich repeat domain-containing protein [Clostridia bacterium]
MRRIFCLLLALVLLSFALPSLAEISVSTASFQGLTVDLSSESIDLGDIQVTDWEAFYAFLSRLPSLTHVDMFATPVRANRIDEMVQRFPDIEFGWTIAFKEHTVRTDATAFSTLHYEDSATHGSSDLSVLRYCTKLQALDFGHNSADDLSFLSDLTDLKVLIIACNNVTDITPLANLTHLEYLELFTNRVSDLTPLSGMNELLDLNICLNSVTDLTPILQLPKLERLWLTPHARGGKGDIPQSQLDEIVKTHPDLELVTDAPNPTAKGWRTHRRYSVIHEMFDEGVYIPFTKSAGPITIK